MTIALFQCLIIIFLALVHEARSTKLLIAIPTVPRTRLRENEKPYLITTLESWREELNSDSARRFIRLVVVSNEPYDLVFEDARARFNDIADFMEYQDVVDEVSCSNPPAVSTAETRSSKNIGINRFVRKQALDLANTLRRASQAFESDEYFTLIEDDFMPCPNVVGRLRDLLQNAEDSYDNWFSIRISFGFSGVILHNGKDVETVASYISQHYERRPPDHLLVELFAGETAESLMLKDNRPHLAFKLNLFKHIGLASTLRSQRDSSPYLDCYQALSTPVVFLVETCSDFDLNGLCAPSNFGSS